MSKVFINVAVLSFSSLLICQQGYAEPKVSVHADLGAYYFSEKNSSGNDTSNLSGNGVNQLEVKVKHLLDEGVELYGEIEVDFDPIQNNDTVQTDDVKLGLKGNFGNFVVGQFDSRFEDKIAEALDRANGEYGKVSELASDNDGRHIQISNQFGSASIYMDLTYAGDSTEEDQDIGASFTFLYPFENGEFIFGLAQINEYADDDGSANSNKDAAGIVFEYEISEATDFALAYSNSESTTGLKTRHAGLAITQELSDDVQVSLVYQDVKVDGSEDTNEYSFNLSYEPYKNLTVYADFLSLGATNDAGDAMETGIRYKF